MWRKWLAPNNASRQQMGFNSGFKGLTWEGKKSIVPDKFIVLFHYVIYLCVMEVT